MCIEKSISNSDIVSSSIVVVRCLAGAVSVITVDSVAESVKVIIRKIGVFLNCAAGCIP